jgi:hypothetical protein
MVGFRVPQRATEPSLRIAGDLEAYWAKQG